MESFTKNYIKKDTITIEDDYDIDLKSKRMCKKR